MDENEAERLYDHLQNVEDLNDDEYEELTATIMEFKLRQLPEAHTVTHGHNLQCDFGEKQMDVVAEVGEGDDEVTAIIECKGSGSTMEKDALAAFAFYLEHSDADEGIYVARSGYQSGAKDVAAECGIQLLQIDRIEPNLEYAEGEITQQFPPYRHAIRVTNPEIEHWVKLCTIVYEREERLALPVLDANGDETGDTIEDRLQESTQDSDGGVDTEFVDGEKVEVEGIEYDLLGARSRKQSEEVSTDIEIDFADRVEIRLRDVLADESEYVNFDKIMHQFAAVETDE